MFIQVSYFSVLFPNISDHRRGRLKKYFFVEAGARAGGNVITPDPPPLVTKVIGPNKLYQRRPQILLDANHKNR